jgi:hypothetical protein
MDMLNAQALETQFHLFTEGFSVASRAFGGQYQSVGPAGHGPADTLLACAIAMCCVQEIHTQFQAFPNNHDRLVITNSLDRDPAEGNFGYHQSSFTQFHLMHNSTPFYGHKCLKYDHPEVTWNILLQVQQQKSKS